MVSTLRPDTCRRPGTVSGSQTIATTSTPTENWVDADRSWPGVGRDPQTRKATEIPVTCSAVTLATSVMDNADSDCTTTARSSSSLVLVRVLSCLTASVLRLANSGV